MNEDFALQQVEDFALQQVNARHPGKFRRAPFGQLLGDILLRGNKREGVAVGLDSLAQSRDIGASVTLHGTRRNGAQDENDGYRNRSDL